MNNMELVEHNKAFLSRELHLKDEEAERAAAEAERKAKEISEAVNNAADTTVSAPVVTAQPVNTTTPTADSKKMKLAIQVVGGAIIGVFSDSDIAIDITILDEDVASQKEIIDFAKLTENFKQLF